MAIILEIFHSISQGGGQILVKYSPVDQCLEEESIVVIMHSTVKYQQNLMLYK